MPLIKIGGSLLAHPRLPALLQILAHIPACLIIPGGGVYADAVRNAQLQAGFDDEEAHWQAIAAMDQSALSLHQLAPELPIVSQQDDLQQAMQQGQTVIWQPYQMLKQDCQLPATWQVTSDSLAAWLALQFLTQAWAQDLILQELILIKATSMPAASSIQQMQQSGLLDGYFHHLLQQIQQQTKVSAVPVYLLDIHAIDFSIALQGLAQGTANLSVLKSAALPLNDGLVQAAR